MNTNIVLVSNLSLFYSCKNSVFNIVVGLFLLLLSSQGKAQNWLVLNHCDCNFTLAMTSGGSNSSSNDYTDGWYGKWDGPTGSHVYAIGNSTNNPMLTFTFPGKTPVTGTLQYWTTPVGGKLPVLGCPAISCATNGSFTVSVNPSTIQSHLVNQIHARNKL